MKVGPTHTTRPAFSLGEGLRLQYEELARWRCILTPEAYNALADHCTEANIILPTGSDGYDVLRGDQLTSFVQKLHARA